MRSLFLILTIALSGCCGAELNGTVLDARTQRPVAGAFVFADGQPDTETDAGGAFLLALPCGDDVSVRITAPGYRDRFDRPKLTGGPLQKSYLLQPRSLPDDAAPTPAGTCVDCDTPVPANTPTCPACGATRLTPPR